MSTQYKNNIILGLCSEDPLSNRLTNISLLIYIMNIWFVFTFPQGSGRRRMLSKNIGLCLSIAATGVQNRCQARPGRDNVAVQAQLPTVHFRLRPSDTRETASRFRLL